jgi:glycosidase
MTMALIATVRGIPQLYYGSEIGMSGDKIKEMLTFVKISPEDG